MSSLVPAGNSPFDSIRKTDGQGEYWLARELAVLLGYKPASWHNFEGVMDDARTACTKSGNRVEDHFYEVVKMITTGKGATREIPDFRLTRYACYLIAQNSDPSKEIVAQAQTYFAVKTRQQEEAEQYTIAEDDRSEDQRRIDYRDKARQANRQIDAMVHPRGVDTPLAHVLFHDAGYEGLYAGERAADIHERKGLDEDEEILDWMGSVELGANIFRITQTQGRIVRDDVTGQHELNETHREVGRKVRKAIEDIGGTMPESLPLPPRSIQQAQRDEQRRMRSGQDLFDLDAIDAPKQITPNDDGNKEGC